MSEYHIYVGADHRGFQKKEDLLPLIRDCHENVIVEDLGAESLVEDDDFNDPALAVAKAVAKDKYSFGVLICGSAHGVCMQANRVKGVRAINASTVASVEAGRADDHANVLCLSGDELDVDTMEKLIKTLCHTRPKMGERYVRRVERLDEEHTKAPGGVEFRLKVAADNEEDDEEE